ncbi:MAG: Tryptophan--tRNA ligase [Candidatus Syntrophoarchaeum sp. GoM_oil]|nr:MAG: Tryptophan--tRNA ligase [Candidatus Syntrophoarchaeum sp. GoM_oil]
MKIDPWGSVRIDDYSKLFDEFGIERFDTILEKFPDAHRLMRRKVIFGHRGYEKVQDAIIRNEPFAVMSGFMPSGRVHLGGKMVMEEIIWHQKMGGDAFVAIADLEAHAVRKTSWKECKQLGVEEYLLSLIALGFEPEGHIYFQSKSRIIQDLTFELGCEVNFTELSAIYGLKSEAKISHLTSVLAQSADILQPEIEAFGGPKPTVIPVGADQDPHIRLARDVSSRMRMFFVEERDGYISIRGKGTDDKALKDLEARFEGKKKLYEAHLNLYGDYTLDEVDRVVRDFEIELGGYGFIPPASTYHRFMSGLTGGKMSSSIPESFIALTEPPESASDKIKRAKTGGRVTLKEQKEFGGIPEECTVYDLLLFHLVEDDREVEEIYTECVNGKRSCGTCKKLAAELMSEFLKDHQELREDAKLRLKEYEVVGLI